MKVKDFSKFSNIFSNIFSKIYSELQEYCLSNYDPNKFLELVKSEEINIHPNNEFIGILKACNDNFKNKNKHY
jgi:hypothetical protein